MRAARAGDLVVFRPAFGKRQYRQVTRKILGKDTAGNLVVNYNNHRDFSVFRSEVDKIIRKSNDEKTDHIPSRYPVNRGGPR